MTYPTPPDALAARLGRRVTARLLSDRRGSRAWEIAADGVHLALKANTPDEANSTDRGDSPDKGDSGRDKAAEVAREAAVLAELEGLAAIEPGYLYASGTWTGGQWLAVDWVTGRPLWRTWALARGPEGDRPSVRPWMLHTASTLSARLAALHAQGWAHADVQPTNILADRADGTGHLIDYALSCGPADPKDRSPYRGALTHTTAPETAAALLGTDDTTHIQATPESDVFSLGATLFWCWTGIRPFAYTDDIDRAEKLRVIATTAPTPLQEARPWPFPALETLITACMTANPADRPTAAELAHQAEEATP